MNSMFVSILQQLVSEQGKEALLNSAKCKAFLADYTHGEYKKESRLLLQAIDAGVQKALTSAVELETCKQQQIGVLREEHFLAIEVAADVVDTLVLVLREVQESEVSQSAVCSNCGKELQKEWGVCPYCGTQVAKIQQNPQQMKPQPIPGSEPVVEVPSPEPAVSSSGPAPVTQTVSSSSTAPPKKKNIIRNLTIVGVVLVVGFIIGNIKIGISNSGQTTATSTVESSNPNQPMQNQTYKIGDRGPAGGFVFYDKGNYSDGWRYMEVSPVDLQNAAWGLYGKDVTGTKREIGFGKQNTELIIAALNRNGESGKAAQLCKAYTLNGYNDWFLPSYDEVSVMLNLKRNNTINMGTFNAEWYWSSQQDNADYGGDSNLKYTWITSSTKSAGYQGSKSAIGGVRAVRYF